MQDDGWMVQFGPGHLVGGLHEVPRQLNVDVESIVMIGERTGRLPRFHR
ncbi:uncharacterized protein METZ01_LOCUS223609, partial [marine metagenome]